MKAEKPGDPAERLLATNWQTGSTKQVRFRPSCKAGRPIMPDDLVFMMGNYEARIPADRSYSRHHMWLQRTGDEHEFRVGLSAYSVRLLQDVYFLDWQIDPDTDVTLKQEIGEVESSKAVSGLFAPVAGRVLEFNEELLADPSGINADGYGVGWLFRMQTTAELMSPEEYMAHLDEGWDKDQRLIKGQINE